ncbi:cytochrome c oxidase assembly protein [Enterovirga aerilata]|uniref:Cytochrome c oxidase assembly protein n=1 Tax=Enterovirga aerilata TaxID=2730920 RepID=A0A849I047_9HYPH|nr:cytochrome c oxidase assembly protein [Enterovirga sp. DB1703]NNM73136.1 cytochrome c oxidase assembly protein [Enterovirga sp. DB1703]
MRTVRRPVRHAPFLVAGLAWPLAAVAHGGPTDAPPSWTFDPVVVVPLIVCATLYVAGTLRLWSKAGAGRGIRPWQVVSYSAGLLALAGALTSPLHWLGERLFTAHMIEHEIVMAVAAPLLALARPFGAFLWAFPGRIRRAAGRLGRGRSVGAAWSVVTRPAVATVLHGAAIWVWHLPPLLDLTVTDIALHRLQHASFLATALLFWWALVRRSNPGAACGHVFVTMLHTGLLGALIALAPRVLYAAQTSGAAICGLTPLEDQQLAGLVMWVPAGTIYAAAAITFLGLWIRGAGPGRMARDAVA